MKLLIELLNLVLEPMFLNRYELSGFCVHQIKIIFQINTKSNPPEYSFGVKHSKYVYGAKPLPGEPIRQIKFPTY